ncbi:MAG: XdhC family protein [Gemmatimonadota bacterium]|nr:XdhC family protein [Gemmatimonadota bacterium]MDH5758041.1 XdhC family protein [Gemmatimonadota bacterium]
MNPALLAELLEARRGKETVVLATRLGDGAQVLLRPYGEHDGAGSAADGGWPVAEARRALEEDRSFVVETEAGDVFLRAYNPPVRLVLVGAVHIAQPLARLATEAGMDVLVVDPRSAWATPERFPGVHLVHAWPQDAIPGLGPDRRTGVVTLTHDPKVDDPALVAALNTPAFYIGALGSRGTHGKRLARLREEGFGDEALARIHGPVGLDIDARTPAEIAVSILAEVVAESRKPARRERA